MALQFDITEEEAKKARIPHEIFLTNLIFNHILVFVTILSASSMAHFVVIVPIASVLSTAYLVWGARRARSKHSWYVSGHWQLCAKRNLFFIMMVVAVSALFAILWLVSGGEMKPIHWALGGAAMLPTMVSVLILIIMESDALHGAAVGKLPQWVFEQNPENALEPVLAENSAQ